MNSFRQRLNQANADNIMEWLSPPEMVREAYRVGAISPPETPKRPELSLSQKGIGDDGVAVDRALEKKEPSDG
jgi:hypothetical protein